MYSEYRVPWKYYLGLLKYRYSTDYLNYYYTTNASKWLSGSQIICSQLQLT